MRECVRRAAHLLGELSIGDLGGVAGLTFEVDGYSIPEPGLDGMVLWLAQARVAADAEAEPGAAPDAAAG